MLNPGIREKPKRHYLRWFGVIGFLFIVFILGITSLFLRHYTMRETIYESVVIINETQVTQTVNTARASVASSADSRMSSQISSKLSMITSSESSSSVSSMIVFIMKEDRRAREKAYITTMGTTTTTLNFDYTSYRIKIPMKFKYCNPLGRTALNGSIIPGDTCMVINSSCCPCETDQIVDGYPKKVGWGGKVDAINQKYYEQYFSTYLKNCTGFGVVCKIHSTASGCNWNAECLGGVCKLVSRF